MIRWCTDEKAERWVARWLGLWVEKIVPGRTVVMHQATVSNAGDEGFAALPRPEPGGRLALLVRVSSNLACLDTCRQGIDWLENWAAADLLPEVLHACDPTPGDARFSASWLTEHNVVAHDGQLLVGCVLARAASAEDLATGSLHLSDESPVPGLHFPVAPGGRLPLPLGPGTWTAPQVAAAYGLTLLEAAPLLNELLCSGVAQWTQASAGPPTTT